MRSVIVLLCGMILCAMYAAPVRAAGRPDHRVTVSVGDYRIEFRDPGAWTFGKIWYGDTQIGLDNGWSGLVLRRPGGGFVGTGHTEGGLEKIQSARLTVDGKEVALEAKARYQGKHARLEKVSRIDNLKLEAVYEITPEGIVETHRIETHEDQPVVTVYAFMHPWTPATKAWMAEVAGGKIVTGPLESMKRVPGARLWQIVKDVRWTAVYDPAAKLSVILCYPELYKGKGVRTGIWDLEHYHKQYYQPYANETIAKGTKRTFRCRIWCVRAEPDAWQGAVRESIKQSGGTSSPDGATGDAGVGK